jgi:hypothetical protein
LIARDKTDALLATERLEDVYVRAMGSAPSAGLGPAGGDSL